MSDELRERLARLDPMHSGVPTEPTTTKSSRELLESIMSTPTKQPTERPAGKSHRRWTLAVAMVSALVLAFAGGLALVGGEETPPTAEPPLQLVAGGEDIMASCIMFSPEELDRVAEIAFEGTVRAVDGDTITISVDTWFRGDEPGEVILRAPQGMEALIGGIPFEVGGQYLISAQGGHVNYCGFSGASTPDLRAGFEAAFAEG